MTQSCLNKRAIIKMLLFVTSWAVLSSCATLGKEECLNADWFTIGYEDGARGYLSSRIGDHREACAKHEIIPNFERYEQGRLAGLREYCTPQMGYGLGASGKPYTYVCPDYLKMDFLEGYRQGKNVYDAQMVVKKQRADLKKMHKDLAAVKQKLSEYETELVKDNSIGPRRRKYLLEEIKILTDEHRAIEAEIIEQQDLLEISIITLDKIRAQNPY